MARLRLNFVNGIINTEINSTATSFISTALITLPVIEAPDYLPIVLDPAKFNGTPEIVYIVSHTVGSNTCTITRAQEGSQARIHERATAWVHAPLSFDFDILESGHADLSSHDNLGLALSQELEDHEALTEDVHGIPDTNDIVLTVQAGANLAYPRPPLATSVYWLFDYGVDVGFGGVNIVNALPGDTYFLPNPP